jgi:hypothetical protein
LIAKKQQRHANHLDPQKLGIKDKDGFLCGAVSVAISEVPAG